MIDVYSFYSAATYNDQLIPDLNGGTRARYTFDAYITEVSDAYDLINSIAGSFRANLFWLDGKVVLTQDRPKDPVRLYGPANVVREVDEEGREGPAFSYNQIDLNNLFTAAVVKWKNPQLGYADDYEYVEGAAAVAKYGLRLAEIEAFGCTDRSSAHTTGEWYVFTSVHQDQVLNFKIPSEGMTLVLGEIARIHNPAKQGKDFSGRIADVLTANSILLDKEVTLESGKIYTLSVLDPNGKINSYPIINGAGSTQVITVSSNFQNTVTIGILWSLQANDLQGEQFQLVRVSEEKDEIYSLELVKYIPSKFDYIERDQPLVELPISNLPNGKPSAPSNLKFIEALVDTDTGVKSKVQLFWSQAEPWVNSWSVEVRQVNASSTFQVYGDSINPYFEILDLDPGAYQFRVRAYGMGRLYVSNYSLIDASVYGLIKQPEALTNLNLISQAGTSGRLSWNLSPDLDVIKGGKIIVKHSPKVSGATWTGATVIDTLPGNATSTIVPLLDGTYLAKVAR